MPISLRQAQKILFAALAPTAPETVRLDQALHRFPWEKIPNPLPLPPFDHALRDGVVLKQRDLARLLANPSASLPITGEIAAGQPAPTLAAGTCLRIMTGAPLPKGGELVLPSENSREKDGRLFVSGQPPNASFIRKKGSDLRGGALLARPGIALQAGHLGRLAESGIAALAVHRRPRVGILCTGSELVAPGSEPLNPGKRYSGNGPLLTALTREAGGEPIFLGLVADSLENLEQVWAEAQTAGIDLLVSTGATGRGKWDLLRTFIAKHNATPLFDGLALRPGGSTFCATPGRTPLLALPGPPGAAALLFEFLARPAILTLQGAARPLPPPVRATLLDPWKGTGNGPAALREGSFFIRKGQACIRTTRPGEEPNAVALLPPGRRVFDKEIRIDVYPRQGWW